MVDRLSEWGVYVLWSGRMVCGNRFITEGDEFNDPSIFNGADNDEDWIGTDLEEDSPRLIHRELCGW